MIPAFNEHGYLPLGVHRATLEEIEERFGRESDMRRVQMESLRWLVELARRAGALRIVVNGSFIADVYEPNDVDCALLIAPDYPTNPTADEELQGGLPFIDVQYLIEQPFESFVQTFFGADRQGIPKGFIEVMP